MLILFLAGLAVAGYGVKISNSTVVVIGGAVVLVTGALLRVYLKRRAEVSRDRKHFGRN